jgi:hypothetical protein
LTFTRSGWRAGPVHVPIRFSIPRESDLPLSTPTRPPCHRLNLLDSVLRTVRASRHFPPRGS